MRKLYFIENKKGTICVIKASSREYKSPYTLIITTGIGVGYNNPDWILFTHLTLPVISESEVVQKVVRGCKIPG
jgi:hypothetical protein